MVFVSSMHLPTNAEALLFLTWTLIGSDFENRVEFL